MKRRGMANPLAGRETAPYDDRSWTSWGCRAPMGMETLLSSLEIVDI